MAYSVSIYLGKTGLGLGNNALITNGTSTSQTVDGSSCQGFGTAVPTLFSGNSTIYATMTVIGLDSGARGQLPVVVTYNASPNSQEA